MQTDDGTLSASDVRALPATEREAILQAAAESAETLYRGERQLTDFEAFGGDDMHGQCSTSPEG